MGTWCPLRAVVDKQRRQKISKFTKFFENSLNRRGLMRPIQWYQFHQVLSSRSLINFQIRFLDPQKFARPVKIVSKIMKNSAIDSFWWVENDSVILEGSIKPFWLNKFKKNDLKWKLIGNQGLLGAPWISGKSLPKGVNAVPPSPSSCLPNKVFFLRIYVFSKFSVVKYD